MKTAITGGIGSGKSYVCQLLHQMGIEVYDCDRAAKRLMRESAEIRQQLTALIGQDTYVDGKLNKAAVARFLLESEYNAKAVDAIVHPAVRHDFLHSGMQWMECAILYESGFHRLVDRVVVVSAPDDVRISRIMRRDGISPENARQWMSRQLPQDVVRSRADIEIVNDGITPLAPQIETLLQ